MDQEEQILSSSHSGGGDSCGGGVSSDRSRNVKQKKVPQRGLGVAQLEKIRLEEQRKSEALEGVNALTNNDSAPTLVVQSPSFGPFQANFQSPNFSFGSSSSIPVQISSHSNGGVEDASLQSFWSPGNSSWSTLWNDGDYCLGTAFGSQGNLQFESNDVAAVTPSVAQRSFCFQRPASPMVHPSAMLTCMEPPSNQNTHGSTNANLWPEECKMVGLKRSNPFSLESPPARAFLGHFDPSSVSSKSRSDELTSCSSAYTTQTESRNICMSFNRDGQPSPAPQLEQNPREILGHEWGLNRNFLTLAPPGAALPASNSKHKYPLDSEGPKENVKNQFLHSGPSSSREESLSFFILNNGSRDKGETVDLNLKL